MTQENFRLTHCQNCGISNDPSNQNCHSCAAVLIKTNPGLEELKKELFEVKTQYEAKFNDLLERIEAFQQQELPKQENKTKLLKQDAHTVTLEVKPEPIKENIPESISVDFIDKVPELRKTRRDTTTTIFPTRDLELQSSNATKTTLDQITLHRRKSLRELIQSIPLISLILEIVESPLASLWEFVGKYYNQYKEKNQLPVFFMTLAGIGALLFGFGYLMQLSISYLGNLSELIKITFGFACSTGITWWATRLYQKGNKYEDFCSALMGLSVALNYLFIYFLSNLSNVNPELSSPLTGFALIMGNTTFAIIIALRYQTKIVALLSLLGGAFAPFYLNTDGASPLYFIYLWILCASSIYLARKIKWKTLGIIGFITSSSIIELSVLNDVNSFSLGVYTIIFHAFAYLFIWFSLFNDKRIADTLNKSSVVLITGNISVFLFNLYYLFADAGYYSILGWVLLANALIFFPGLWSYKKDIARPIKLLLLVIAGTFVAFAIPALLDKHLMGLFWSIEALGLIYLGYNFALPSVRKEGYLLFLIALIKTILTFGDIWFMNGNHQLLTSGYLNLLALGPLIGMLVFIFKKYESQSLEFEKRLLTNFKNSAIVWFLISYLLTAACFTYNWLAFASVMVALAIIIIGYITKLHFSRGLGYLVFVASVVYSALHAIIHISTTWNASLFTSGYANLVGIGIFLLAFMGVHFQLHARKPNLFMREKSANNHHTFNWLAIWFTALFLVTAFHEIGNYAFNLIIIPMFAFIYLGYNKKSIFIEYLGIAYASIMMIGIAFSISEIGSFRFTLQPLWGKIVMIELLFSMWFLRLFYAKLAPGSNMAPMMDKVREVFYWIVPLLILSPVKRHFPEYLPLALWGSALIIFFIYEATKRKSLIIEFTLIATAAALWGLFPDNYWATVMTSLLVLGLVIIIKQGYNKTTCMKSEFSHVFVATPYYLGACLFIIVSDVISSDASAFIASSLFFSIMVIFRTHIAPLQNNFLVSFWLSLFLAAVGIGLTYLEEPASTQLISLAPFIPIGFILYGNNSVYTNHRKTTWLALIFILHSLIFIGYSLIIAETILTVTIILHAIALLFNSLKIHSKPLVWMSVAFFAMAILKLYIWDIAHFSMLQKVFVFVLIGALLLGASFLFVKVKDRFELPEEDEIVS